MKLQIISATKRTEVLEKMTSAAVEIEKNTHSLAKAKVWLEGEIIHFELELPVNLSPIEKFLKEDVITRLKKIDDKVIVR